MVHTKGLDVVRFQVEEAVVLFLEGFELLVELFKTKIIIHFYLVRLEAFDGILPNVHRWLLWIKIVRDLLVLFEPLINLASKVKGSV